MYELCGRTKPGGGKCASPALKGKSFCYYHDPRRLHRAKAVKRTDDVGCQIDVGANPAERRGLFKNLYVVARFS